MDSQRNPASTSEGLLELDERLTALPRCRATRLNTALLQIAYFRREETVRAYPGVYEIEVSSICRMRCTHCPRHFLLNRPTGHMTPEMLATVFSAIRPYAQNLVGGRLGEPTNHINLLHYGEPALSPHYGTAIRMARLAGLTSVSSSTACEFGDDAIRAAVEEELDELLLIFDGLDDETFKAVRGQRASFTRGMAQIEKLLAAKRLAGKQGPAVTAVMIRHPANRHQWDAFEALFSAMPGVSHQLATFSAFNGAVASIVELKKQLADDPVQSAADRHAAELNTQVCNYPWSSVCVLSDGRVVPCCRDVNGSYVLGDLKHQSLSEIWNGPAMVRLRRALAAGDRDNPLCRRCTEASLEIGLPRLNLKELEDLVRDLERPPGAHTQEEPA